MSATDVQIIDARGDILRTIRLSDEVAKVQVDGLTPGVYFLKASSYRSVSTTTVVVQ